MSGRPRAIHQVLAALSNALPLVGKALASLAMGLVSTSLLVLASSWLLDADWGEPLGVVLLVVGLTMFVHVVTDTAHYFLVSPTGRQPSALTATLADYLVPSAAELPSYEPAHTETPTPLNPLGAQGIGESGTIGSTPAVHNAVVDALAHLGVRHIDMPVTPERVWRAIQEGTP